MSLRAFLDILGPEIEEPEEETFLLFSQSIPSQNLGFVDSKATVLDLTIGDRDLTIYQSPTILSSNRQGGTTGAVVWKITPLFASWLASPSNVLREQDVLNANSAVLELGCGISGVIGLTVGPHVSQYVLTDQDYVMKLLNQNLTENWRDTSGSSSKGRTGPAKAKRGSAAPANTIQTAFNITAKTLDWESDQVTKSLTGVKELESFDVVIACDCIYNDALIAPLVQTCVDACQLRTSSINAGDGNPTVCIVAQQLRSAEVFESWLESFHERFRVWRVPDEKVIDELKSSSGFVVHVGILK